VHVIGSDVARRSRKGLRSPKPDDDEVFVDNPGGCQGDIVLLIVTAQSLAQIDRTAFSKARNRLAGGGIEGIQVVHHSREQARLPFLIQIGQASARAGKTGAGPGLDSLHARVEFPSQLAGGCIQCNDLQPRRESI
jgi:hypothetical protein